MSRAAAPAFDDLRPFLAPVLLRAKGAARGDVLLTKVADLAAQYLEKRFKEGDRPRPLLRPAAPGTASGSMLTFIVYEDHASPSWWKTGPKEVHRQLIILAVLDNLIALCGTDAATRDGLVGALRAEAARLEREEMIAAFLGPQAKTVWLKGVHTPSAVKASGKVLSGAALELALDPLGDQTYYLSAARSRPTIKGLDRPAAGAQKPAPQTLGASPSKGRVWVGWPPEWKAFAEQLNALLAHVNAKPKAQAPSIYHKLATVVADLGLAQQAYAMALTPQDLFSEDDGVSDEARHLAHDWAYEAGFEITLTAGATFEAKVGFFGRDIGKILVTPARKGEQVVADCQWIESPQGFDAEREACRTFVQQPDSLKVYYRDHTLSDGALYRSGWTDHPFDWKPISFAGYDLWREKPKQAVIGVVNGKDELEPLAQAVLRADDNSLFDFVREKLYPTGYLACDDGAMEIADFVHVDLTAAKVSLIHVKGSGVKPKSPVTPKAKTKTKTKTKAKVGAQVSVADFEVVVAQAIKNLRHLDRTTLVAALKKGKRHQIAQAIWLDGKKIDRDALIGKLKTTTILKTEVVILQPRLTEAERDYCESKPDTLRGRRYRQLNALMLGARLSAMACGASFEAYIAK